MNEAIEDGVGDRGISDDLIPAFDGHLAGDDDREPLVAVFDDLQEVTALVVIELFRPPVVQDKQVGSGKRLERPGIVAMIPCQCECSEEPWRTVIDD